MKPPLVLKNQGGGFHPKPFCLLPAFEGGVANGSDEKEENAAQSLHANAPCCAGNAP